MSPKIPVCTLRELAIYTIKECLVQYVKRHGCNEDEMCTYHNLDILPHLVEEILSSVLADWDIRMEVRYCILRILLDENTKKLELGKFDDVFQEGILTVLRNAKQLEYIDFSYTWIKSPELNINAVWWTCEKLHTICMTFVCTDKILAAIGSLCHCLRHLDVSDSESITSRGLEDLCLTKERGHTVPNVLCTTLRYLNVGMTSSDNFAACEAVVLLLWLRELRAFPQYPFTGQVLELVQGFRGKDYTCDLKILRDSYSDVNRIRHITGMAPHVQELHLDYPACPFTEMTHLQNLTSLKVSNFDAAGLSSVLGKMIPHVKKLALIQGHGLFDLSSLSQLPRLEYFECYYMQEVTCSCPISLPAIIEMSVLSTFTSKDVKHLLHNVPCIKVLILGDCGLLSDAELAEIIDKNSNFPDLGCFIFGKAERLTANSVQLLVQLCSEMTELGVLSEWNITSEQILELMELLDEGNVNCRLE